MKKSLFIISVLALAASLQAQSVADLSRSEKARRESLKGVKIKLVTNSDLAVIGKTPAVGPATERGAAPNAGAEDVGQSAAPEVGYLNTPIRQMVPNVVPEGPRLIDPAEDAQAPGTVGDLETRLKAAQDRVELLTTRMNALWQEFYSLNTMTTQGAIQKQIDETYQKLLKAQELEAGLKARLEAGGAKPPSNPDHAPRP
jgi:hypothetical protein